VTLERDRTQPPARKQPSIAEKLGAVPVVSYPVDAATATPAIDAAYP
jgi:hypothetical protein